jgi:O-antigen/teichoic acid export membrane protein
MVFVAMDADYFPRLSATGEDITRRNDTINRQIDVLVMLMAPFLIIFSLFLPILVRILYTEEFMLVVPMALCAASYMFFKAVYAPISYLALARGDSLVYFLMETLYDIVFVCLVCAGYYIKGLVGAGLALSAANLFDLLAISTVYSHRYGFRFQTLTVKRTAIHFLLLAASLAACIQPLVWLRTAVCVTAAAISLRISWKLMCDNTELVGRATAGLQRLRSRLRRERRDE